MRELTEAHVEKYALEGYRTLCFAYRELGEDEYQTFQAKYAEAAKVCLTYNLHDSMTPQNLQ